MAQLLSPAGPAPGRISQILPTVKCSNCNQPVAITDLEDHICAPPTTPAATSKPPMSPTSASFLHQKYQNVIANRSAAPQTPTSGSPLRSPPMVPPAREGSPLGAQRVTSVGPPAQQPRTRAPSTASLNVPGLQNRPERVPSPLARGSTPDAPKVAFPTRSGPSEPLQRVPSPLSPRQTFSEPIRTGTPSSISSRTSSEPGRPLMSPDVMRSTMPMRRPSPAPSTSSMNRAPSDASVPPGQYGVRHPVQSSPVPYASIPSPGAKSPTSHESVQRPRAATDVPPADVLYSTSRPGAPPGPSRGPPPSPNMDMQRAPSNASSMHNPYAPPSMPVGGVFSHPGMIQRQQTPQPALEIDTKTGGEAGMAGVGRRGFAAAARAAMFMHQVGAHAGSQMDHLPDEDGIHGMDGRRANAPRYLDITSATNYPSATTPPLSAGSGSSPRSPYSQGSPLSARIPSPNQDGRTSVTPTAIARTPSPSERSISFIQRDRILPPPLEPPKVPLPATPQAPATPSLPFFEKFKNKQPNVDTEPEEPVNMERPPSPDGSESEFGGLAYADSDDDDDATSHAGTVKPDDISSAKPQNKVRFPSMSSRTQSIRSESKYSSGSSSSAPSPRLPMRSLSASTSYSLRSVAKSTGALDRTMETLFEEDPTSPTASSVSSPAMFSVPLGEGQRDSMNRIKLPTRSHTSPGLGPGRPESRAPGKKRAPKMRSCLKCDRSIDDGRWIQMEGGGVMCDRCWKNMYLPKCRRCNLSIEKAAVSSSDGQLKGKYHRDCFNCHTCQKPFPDKTFYVFDGKPFCAYHYHEANDSLCAAATCGQPIEGPCAVSHAGDRYHPEHLLCEHPRCSERLVEYWEVDGRMLCEKHSGGVDSDDEDDLPLGVYAGDSARATKRVTRFIDLSGGIGLGPPS